MEFDLQEKDKTQLIDIVVAGNLIIFGIDPHLFQANGWESAKPSPPPLRETTLNVSQVGPFVIDLVLVTYNYA